MTTQMPYGPTPPQAAADYPTAPPWAPAQQVPAAAHPPPFVPYGGLMVPHPEEMYPAGRPKPPAWWPVVPFTFVFPLGLVSAIRRSRKAHRQRNDQYPYWIAFGVTFVVASVVWLIAASVMLALAVPAYLDYREAAITKTVQSNIVHDGTFPTSGTETVSGAACTPTADRAASGLRPYRCDVTLGDGRTGTVRVSADSDGHWKMTR
jgi:hypothetical protein